MLSDHEEEVVANTGNYSTKSSQKPGNSSKQSQQSNGRDQEKVQAPNPWSNSTKVRQNEPDDWDTETLSSQETVQAPNPWSNPSKVQQNGPDDWHTKKLSSQETVQAPNPWSNPSKVQQNGPDDRDTEKLSSQKTVEVPNAWSSNSSKIRPNDCNTEELSSHEKSSDDWPSLSVKDNEWEPKVTENRLQFSSVTSEKSKQPLRRPNLESG